MHTHTHIKNNDKTCKIINGQLSVGLRIHWLYLPDEGLDPSYSEIGETEECEVSSSLPLLPSPLWHRELVPVSITSLGQIYLFKNYSYWQDHVKENLLNNFTKNVDMNIQWMQFPNLWA